jgi:hypothetical protein
MKVQLSNNKFWLYQWDTKQKVLAPDGILVMHFRVDDENALPVEVVDGWAEIPAECLQSGENLTYYAYDTDHTLDAAQVEVKHRPKPADYIYTPTEIKTWESLDARIKTLENGAPSAGDLSLGLTGATVGQTVKISAVDDNGVPTAWEPVDMASGGGGEKWEKIADVALTADVSSYQLADFGTYRKVKALISRDTYVSGLNKNVWFRVGRTDQGANAIATAYVTGEYGYVASEINAEMGDMFTHVGVMSTNNRLSQQYDKRTIDVASPANPSAYGLYMVFVDTSVIQSGDTATVYGVKR